MLTQRDIDTWHVAAQDKVQQLRDEFGKSLMGARNAKTQQQQPVRPERGGYRRPEAETGGAPQTTGDRLGVPGNPQPDNGGGIGY